MHVHRVVARIRPRFPASRKMIYDRPLCAIVKKRHACSARAQAGRELTRESEVKDATINGSERPVGDSEYILYDANAGYQQTLLSVVTRPVRKTGLRSHRHHQHHRTGGSDPMERHETQDPVRSSAVEARFQCVRVRAQRPGLRAQGSGPAFTLAPAAASSRLLRLARGRPGFWVR